MRSSWSAILWHELRQWIELSPYLCNVCEFLGTNYCMPTRWLTGPLQKIPPWLKPLVTPLTVGGRHFSTRPGAALPQVGALTVHKNKVHCPGVVQWWVYISLMSLVLPVCRDKLRNLRADCSTVEVSCVTITWQRTFTSRVHFKLR